MKCRQGDTFTPIVGSWVIRDILPTLLKKTEVASLILNFDITGVLAAGVEAIDMLDQIDIKLTRDGNKTLVDCTAGDLQRLGMVKHKSNYGNIGTIAALGVQPIELIIPFEDKARPNPKDTSLIVDTIKSLQLEFRNNNPVTDVTIGNVETMAVYETQKSSLRVTSDRYLLRSGITIAGAGDKQGYPLQSAYRTLCMIIGTLTNLSYLSIDGDDDTLVDGEPDEIIAFAQDAMSLNPPDIAITGAGALLTATCIPIPFINNGEGYGGTKEQKLNLRFNTTGAMALDIFQDFVEMPDVKKINSDIATALPYANKADYRRKVVAKNSSVLSKDQAIKATVIPQVKISPVNTSGKASNQKTSDVNIDMAYSNSD